MPVLTTKKDSDGLEGEGSSSSLNEAKEEPVKQVSLSAPPTKEPQQDSLLDLLGGDPVSVEQPPVSVDTGGNSLLDLLDSTPSMPTTGNM